MKTIMENILDGILVIDLSRLLPGPYCSMILADYGARVIAIEGRQFEEESKINPLHLLNRNKEHMVLNLKKEEGREIFLKLVKKADVLMEGFRPGVMQRLGLDYISLKKENPKLIYCSITGYGQTGAYCNMVGHDINYLAISGVLSQIGTKERPVIPGIQIADIAGGALNAALAIMMALFYREKTGKGQYIDISMVDGLAALLYYPLGLYKKEGKFPKAASTALSGGYACYNIYKTKDEKYIAIGAVEKKFWANLIELLGLPVSFVEDQYNPTSQEEIINELRRIFKKRNRDEWEDLLGDKEVCFSSVLSLEECMEDPHIKERKIFTTTLNNSGTKEITIRPHLNFSLTYPGEIKPSPYFGQDTIKILKELGYERNIHELQKKEVI